MFPWVVSIVGDYIESKSYRILTVIKKVRRVYGSIDLSNSLPLSAGNFKLLAEFKNLG